MSGDHNQYQKPDVVTITASDLKTIRVREVEIEFKEWIHPHMGLVPVDPKTPLILKAVIRERGAPALERMNKAAEDNGEEL